jgi:hypothetical protein
MCAIIKVMNLNPPLSPLPDETALVVHDWLLQEQHRLAEKVGEPLFVTIRIVYDGSFEVDVKTFSGQQGVASGESLSKTLATAVETLRYVV